MRLDPLAVHYARDGGDIEARNLCDVLEHHGLQIALVSVYKVIVLVVDNGLHGALERILALAQGLDEPLGRIDLLLHERGGFLVGLGVGQTSVLHNLRVLAVDAEFRHVETRHGQDELTVFVVQVKVRNHLLGLVVVGVVDLPAGRRIEPANLVHDAFHFLFAEVQPRHDFLEVPVLERIELIGNHADGVLDGRRAFFVLQLDEQALAKVTGAHAGRLEFLDYREHVFHFLGR